MKTTSRSAHGCLSTTVKRRLEQTAARTIYGLLLFYYVLSSSDTAWNDKLRIYGAVGYIFLPYDLIPESIHIIGCTDDFAAIFIGCKAIRANITAAVASRARKYLRKRFGVRIQKTGKTAAPKTVTENTGTDLT